MTRHVRREQSEERFAQLTPCTCSAQRQRADRAEVTAEAAQTARERAQREVLSLRSEVESLRGCWRSAATRAGAASDRAEAAEVRARRAEDALQRILENFGGDPIRLLGPYHRAAIFHEARRALSAAGQTSDATPSDTTTKED